MLCGRSVDVTIVNVALPTLVRSLGATVTGLQWVVGAYSLASAAFVLAAGPRDAGTEGPHRLMEPDTVNRYS